MRWRTSGSATSARSPSRRCEGAPFRGAQRAERAAPGSPDDGVLWRLVQEQAEADSRGSLSFYAFMTVAVALAAIAVITDSSVLVVGAMVVGPEFAAIAAAATGVVLGRLDITRRAIGLLARSFAGARARRRGPGPARPAPPAG